MLNIIINEIRSYFRSASNIFFTVFFPSACVFLLGTFLESVEVSDAAVGELSIAYCTDSENAFSDTSLEELMETFQNGELSMKNIDSDKILNFDYTAFSVAAAEAFIKEMENEGMLTAEKISHSELEKLDTSKYSAAVEIKGTDIIVHGGSDDIKNRAVKAVFDSYARDSSAYASAAMTAPEVLGNIEVSDESFVSHKDLGTNRSMMDYYAVAMAVMIIFMGSCIGGASAYSEEYENSTILRLNAAPISRTTVFFGKIIGSMPLVLMQVFSVMFMSTIFFGAHYCNTLSGNVLLIAMFIAVSLAVLSAGVLINLFFPKIPSNLVIMPVMWVLLFLSGTFAMDIYVEGLTNYMPMYIIQKAAFDLTLFNRTEKTVNVIIVSLAIFAVMIFIGWIKVNTRRKNS